MIFIMEVRTKSGKTQKNFLFLLNPVLFLTQFKSRFKGEK